MARSDWAVARDGGPLNPAKAPPAPAAAIGSAADLLQKNGFVGASQILNARAASTPLVPAGTKLPTVQPVTQPIKPNTPAQEQQARAAGISRQLDPLFNAAAKDVSPLGAALLNVAPSLGHLARGEHVSPAGAALDIAGLLPFGRAARGARAIVKGATAAKEAGAVAKAIETPLGTAKEVSGQLGKAARLGREQKALRTEELGRRIKAGAEASAQAETPAEAHMARLKALQGALPKLQWGGFQNLDDNALKAIQTHIEDHPDLGYFDKIHAHTAIYKVTNGELPTASEGRLLGRIFGSDAAQNIISSSSFWKKFPGHVADLMNVPRSIVASFDLSAPFRQGLVAVTAHPVMAAKAFPTMVKAAASEPFYQQTMRRISAMPTFDLMQKGGIAFTDLGSPLRGREEQFFSRLAENIPVLGHAVRASGRGYVSFLNQIRADYADFLIGRLANPEDQKALEDVAKFVNAATGRAGLWKLESAAVPLNTLFFSPRLFASRVALLNPLYLTGADPVVQRELWLARAKLASTAGAILYLAKLGGAKVNLDPTNADWGKIRIGNTRIDILGGFQQPLRLAAQLVEGKVTSSSTGKTLRLGPSGPGKLSRKDIVERFLASKLAPTPSLGYQALQGQTAVGQPLRPGAAAYNFLTPLAIQDALSVGQSAGSVPAGLAAYLGSGLGVGVQNYGARSGSGGFVNLPPLGSGTGGSVTPLARSGGRGGWSHTR